MSISLQPFGSTSPISGYIGWTPVPLIVTNKPDGRSGRLKLTSRTAEGSVAKVQFLEQVGQPPRADIELDLAAGTNRKIFICGQFQPGERHNGASPDKKDITIEAHWTDDLNSKIASTDVMIRVRRDANEMTDKAIEDFLFALAKLNGIPVDGVVQPGPGKGIYVTDFVDMHVDGANLSQHRDSHFLPWHRLYLLDLERQLQSVLPQVSLPYWRFDRPAPRLFTKDFIGETRQIPRDVTEPGGELDEGGTATPRVHFSLTNPLARWQIRDVQGIPRTARFDPSEAAASGIKFEEDDGGDFPLITQNQTLGLGGGANNLDDARMGDPHTNGGFAVMEGTPHGAAHMSFNGPINAIGTAPRDPLFFLLHCNVDRLWGLWQSLFDRYDPEDVRTYPYQVSGDAEDWLLKDAQQWPWDNSLSRPDNIAPPGTRAENFPHSDVAMNFSNNSPTLAPTIDLNAERNPANYLGFGYDDIPYSHPAEAFV